MLAAVSQSDYPVAMYANVTGMQLAGCVKTVVSLLAYAVVAQRDTGRLDIPVMCVLFHYF